MTKKQKITSQKTAPKDKKIDKSFRLSVAQISPILGDVAANLAKAREARDQAAIAGADLVIFPSFFLTGWPLYNLELHPILSDECQQAVESLMRDTADGGPAVLMLNMNVHKFMNDNWPSYQIQLLDGGQACEDVDDVFELRGLFFAAVIYADEDNVKKFADGGAQFVIAFDEQPYQSGLPQLKCEQFRQWGGDCALPLIYINLVGGYDGLVFDGGSFGLHADGSLAFRTTHFAQSVAISQWENSLFGWQCVAGFKEDLLQEEAADYQACMIGLRDYVNNNGFKQVILGLSGGVDSALCAALAVDALGPERVQTVMLPYHYTSQESLRDAKQCAEKLDCAYQSLPISGAVEAFFELLQPVFSGTNKDLTEENLQSRCRGVILMALSNKFGSLLLTTGNKSEAAVGYATLYGDMCGGFNPIKDLYKRQVYALCNWRNAHMPIEGLGLKGQVIPQNIIDRPPSAELRPDQKDEDSLPPYPVLDSILHGLIEEGKSIGELVYEGHARDVVEHVEELLYRGEFKRQQSAPGVKISHRSFGHEWRMPLTHRFRDKD